MVELQLLYRIASKDQMPVMNGVKRAAEKSDPHAVEIGP